MDKNIIFEKVTDIINEITDIDKDKVTGDALIIEDLDLASMEIMTILAEIEEELSIKIDQESMENISTIDDLVNAINQQCD